jgi:hypothetical protein
MHPRRPSLAAAPFPVETRRVVLLARLAAQAVRALTSSSRRQNRLLSARRRWFRSFLGLPPSSPMTHRPTTAFSDGSFLSFLFSVLFCWERTRTFLWRAFYCRHLHGGLSLCLSYFSLCFRFEGLDQLPFATRWSHHLVEDHNPSFIFITLRDIRSGGQQ